MISKEAASNAADELLAANAAPMREKRRASLKRRYAVFFGRDMADRCVDNPQASEEAIAAGRTQWQLVVTVAVILSLTVASAFADESALTVSFALFGAVVSKTLMTRYARRHFERLVG